MSTVEIGIDLGGTRIKAVAIDTDGRILHQCYFPTKDGDDKMWKNAVAEAVIEIKSRLNTSVSNIGIAAPGLPNQDHSAISFMPGRLQGLENFIWQDFLQTKAIVLNDAIAALMAEARFGAAKTRKNVVMLTLGTGVGGAILIDGKPYQGAFNKAGHIGHMVINDKGEQDITGMPGSLEDAIGNVTMEKRSYGKFANTYQLIDALRMGDDFAKEVWHTSVKKLAVGIASVTNILSPEMIILGGGIAEVGSDLFEPLKEYLNLYEWRPGGHQVEIAKAQFGDLAGAIGAACFSMEYSG